MTEIAAMEFLFPYEQRKIELAKNRKNNTKKFYYEIAKKYKVPRLHVENYLSREYMEDIGSFDGFQKKYKI